MAYGSDDTAPPSAAKSTCVMLLLGFTRLLVLGYIAVAALSFLEARKLLVGSQGDAAESGHYEIKDNVLYVPLVLCVPAQMEINGKVFSADLEAGVTKCSELDYLINACSSSLLLSGAAALFWIFCDMTARFRDGAGCGPLNRHTAAGMGLLLIFLLAQAGISTGALVEQIKFWTSYTEEVFDNIEDGPKFDDVESYANTFLLTVAAIGSFGTALVMLLDAAVYSCMYKPQVKRHSSHMDDVNAAQYKMDQQALAVDSITQGQEPYNFGRTNTSSSSTSTPKSSAPTADTAGSPASLESGGMGGNDPFASTAPSPAAAAPTWANPFTS